jgi:hypothetical protein
VNLPATPVTAVLAGVFSALTWSVLSPLLTDPRPSSTAWLVGGVLLLVAVPAHLFVIGVGEGKSFGERTLEPAFQKRLVCWLVAAAATTGLASLWR